MSFVLNVGLFGLSVAYFVRAFYSGDPFWWLIGGVMLLLAAVRISFK